MATFVDAELVVLLDEHRQQTGTAQKSAVHDAQTPLHLGFSCYVFDADGRVLLTRRSLTKRTWPGVWTNSFCGHPAPGEPLPHAVRRHATTELGLDIEEPICALPNFRYCATDADGTAENEICPVYCVRAAGPIDPNPDEVAEWVWMTWDQLVAAAALPRLISSWVAAQIPKLNSPLPRCRAHCSPAPSSPTCRCCRTDGRNASAEPNRWAPKPTPSSGTAHFSASAHECVRQKSRSPPSQR
jgi:isopentenyl-diphosphate delta-isomerase